MAGNPTVPLVLDPVPETIDSIYNTGEAGTSLVSSLSQALNGRQVLGDSYVPLDLGSWVASSDPTAADELTRQATTGNDSLGALLGTRPDRRTTVVDRSDTPEALTRLNEVGVDQLVIPEDQLGPLSGQAAQVTFTQRFDVVNSEGRAMHAVMADAALADRLTATDDPVLNAHLVIADLATLFFDRPNTARGAVLAVPGDLDVPEETYDALLTSLARPSVEAGNAAGGHQIIAAMTLDDLFDATQAATTSRNATLVRPYTADAPAGLGSLLDDVRSTRARISSFATIVASSDAGKTRIPPLDRQVLIAESARLDDDTRRAYLDGVGASIDGQLSGIVTPADQRVTLTDRSRRHPTHHREPTRLPRRREDRAHQREARLPRRQRPHRDPPPGDTHAGRRLGRGQGFRRLPPRRHGPITRRLDLTRVRPLHRALHSHLRRRAVPVDRRRGCSCCCGGPATCAASDETAAWFRPPTRACATRPPRSTRTSPHRPRPESSAPLRSLAMAGVRIVTDSASDLSVDDATTYGIEVVPLTIRFGSEEFVDREQLSVSDFYRRMAASSALPETAAPSPGAFEEAFRKAAADGADAVVCINLSSELSATMQSAQNAAKAVAGDIDVRVIDSKSITAGLGDPGHRGREAGPRRRAPSTRSSRGSTNWSQAR